MAQRRTQPDLVSEITDAARRHGIASEPDHEVGDLLDALRMAWSQLTLEQQRQVHRGRVRSELPSSDSSSPEARTADEDLLEAARNSRPGIDDAKVSRMIRRIVLENFRSFGAAQTIKLGGITVLVGPNNAGKSAFMSVGALFKAIRHQTGLVDSLTSERSGFVHRPLVPPGQVSIEVHGNDGTYSSRLALQEGIVFSAAEALVTSEGGPLWTTQRVNATSVQFLFPRFNTAVGAPMTAFGPAPFSGLGALAHLPARDIWAPLAPLTESRLIRLSIDSLRQDAPPTHRPQLASSGEGLAQVVAHWRESYPSKAQELDEFVSRCVPEISNVLTSPAPEKDARGQAVPAGTKRLVVLQKDGERFDATMMSDGLLCFIALAMNAIDSSPGSILFVEEPETSIHPTRIHQLIDLFRRTADQRKCQIVLATHSPQLLNEFRDEPESILVFRRSPTGTQVRSADQLPSLDGELLPPGDMLQSGFFDKEFEQLMRTSPDSQGA